MVYINVETKTPLIIFNFAMCTIKLLSQAVWSQLQSNVKLTVFKGSIKNVWISFVRLPSRTARFKFPQRPWLNSDEDKLNSSMYLFYFIHVYGSIEMKLI